MGNILLWSNEIIRNDIFLITKECSRIKYIVDKVFFMYNTFPINFLFHNAFIFTLRLGGGKPLKDKVYSINKQGMSFAKLNIQFQYNGRSIPPVKYQEVLPSRLY